VSVDKNWLSSIQRQTTNQLRKVSYPFKYSTLAKLRESVQDLRDNLALGLQALELDTTEQNTRLLTSLDLHVDQVKDKLESLSNRVLDDNLRKWLSPTNPETYLQPNMKQWSPQSGDWFLQGQAFDNWIRKPGSLWLTGMPGFGKSIMCSAAIALTAQRRLTSKPALIAYHFHTFSDPGTRTVSAMLRNLVYQLARESDDILNALTTLFNRCDSGSRNPSDIELAALLRTVLSYHTDIYIFLDALDESQEQIELVEIVKGLQAEVNNTHIFVTSRRHAVFVDAIESGNVFEVRMDREIINIDIERCVQQQLANDITLQKYSPGLRTKIGIKLSDADGM
jgi:DNA replication protein DnaC